jgi:hypothetical protein
MNGHHDISICLIMVIFLRVQSYIAGSKVRAGFKFKINPVKRIPCFISFEFDARVPKVFTGFSVS